MTFLPPSSNRIGAVVIGASAGGIEALQELLPALTPDFPAPVVIVLHLPEDGGGLLAEVLGRHCQVSVRHADDKEPLEPARVYVAPARYHLLIGADRRCSLSQEDPVKSSRPSIDVTFESAAAAYGGELLGILLTGANDDGAAGLLAIRRAGGTTWAQRPDTARKATMPQSAMALGAVDQVLSLAEMAHSLRDATRFRRGTA